LQVQWKKILNKKCYVQIQATEQRRTIYKFKIIHMADKTKNFQQKNNQCFFMNRCTESFNALNLFKQAYFLPNTLLLILPEKESATEKAD
jgi:hypothetical protein